MAGIIKGHIYLGDINMYVYIYIIREIYFCVKRIVGFLASIYIPFCYCTSK